MTAEHETAMAANAATAFSGTVAQALAEIMSGLTPRERRAAEHLAAHYPVAGLAPMARFARSTVCELTPALRLLAKLGFES
ncbi:hypothetical protein ACIKTA_03790, partial [Hansschlegelia beijingensis]